MRDDRLKSMPDPTASAVDALAHPLAGAAALSALGIGLANQAFGIWIGAVSGALQMQQQFLERASAALPDAPAANAQTATETQIAEACQASRVSQPAAGKPEPQARAKAARVVEQSHPVMEDLRRPKAIDKVDRPNDLKAISGIGPKLEQVLNGLGIWTYGQIAELGAAEIGWLDDALGFTDRIGRDDWVGQARGLTGQATKH